jgi:hypothetical protein
VQGHLAREHPCTLRSGERPDRNGAIETAGIDQGARHGVDISDNADDRHALGRFHAPQVREQVVAHPAHLGRISRREVVEVADREHAWCPGSRVGEDILDRGVDH